jgi:hypothetical protein
MFSTPSPTLYDIERIVSLPNIVIRNLQITQCYHELALVLAKRTDGICNWCTFATWASKQAGQTIRKEDLSRRLEVILGKDIVSLQAMHNLSASIPQMEPDVSLGRIIDLAWKAFDPQTSFERSSQAVSRGNLKVFEEIGREFARFYSTCLPDSIYNEENITSFLSELRPGDPPKGQSYLRQAFMHYYRALFESDRKARLDLILLANLEIGYHEQTRLQPEINEALTTPVISPEAFARNLMKMLNPNWGLLNELIWRVMRMFGRLTALDTAVLTYYAAAQREAQFLITETMMTIDLPVHHQLRLGRDLTVIFPPDLQQLSNPELLALLERIDPTRDSTYGSGAEYWGDLLDRLHFIADMFRCYHISPQLFDPPFTLEQTNALREGRLPSGRL